MSFDYYEGLDCTSKARYDQKIKLIGLNECPYKLQAGCWKNDPTNWPTIEYGDIHNFLIETPGIFTRQAMKNYKSLEAHNYFRSGWVETVFTYQLHPSQHILLNAKVKPSQRLSESPHSPWIAANKSGQILASHCTCMAGLSESCSHVAAVLFKIEAAVRLGYTTKACTEEPCKWNQDFVKKIGPDPIAQISFYSDTKVEKSRQRNKKRKFQFEPSKDNEQTKFLDALKCLKSKPVVLSCFNSYSEDFHWKQSVKPNPKLPPSLRTLYNESNTKLTESELDDKCKAQLQKMELSEESIKFINKSTTTQSDNLMWYEQRMGRITSSTVHAITHTNIENPAKSIILSVCKPRHHPLKCEPVLWGKNNEDAALSAYNRLLSSSDTKHQNVCLRKEGFQISNAYPFIGVSVDSLMTCDCHGITVVEVKCPYTAKDQDCKTFLGSSNCHLENNLLKKSHKYYSQVQLQMFVYNAKFCDFITWAPKFVIITYVQRDDEFINDMLNKCKNIYVSHILPELHTRRLEMSQYAVVTQEKPNQQKLYCSCQMPQDEREYIGCDNPDCETEWYHLQCLKIKRKPKGQWFCPTCRK